jgi:hypothetical protein
VRKHRFALLRSSWDKLVIILIVEDNAAIPYFGHQNLRSADRMQHNGVNTH